MVKIDVADPSQSALLCSFPVRVLASPIGGPCAFENAAIRIDFSRRLLVNIDGRGRLVCLNGVITIRT